MSNFKFVLDKNGVAELLKSAEMKEVTKEMADGFAAQCGEGYEVQDKQTKTRVGYNVVAATDEAVADNWDNNTLEKVLHSYPEKK